MFYEDQKGYHKTAQYHQQTVKELNIMISPSGLMMAMILILIFEKSSYNIYMVYLHEDSQRKGKEE